MDFKVFLSDDALSDLERIVGRVKFATSPAPRHPSQNWFQIIETGNEVEAYACKLFPAGILIEGRDAKAQEITLRHIAQKTPLLFQPVFVKDGFLAALDVLQFDSKTNGYFLYEVGVMEKQGVQRDSY